MRSVQVAASLILILAGACGATCSISITSPTNGSTVSGPIPLTATTTGCPSAVRYNWFVSGQPLPGNGTYEYNYTVPTCDATGACTGTYQMPNGFGFYNASFLADGTFPITVQAIESAGTVLATSSAVNITLNDSGWGQCSLTSPNFGVAQSGTVNLTIHCPWTITPTGTWTDGLYDMQIDGLEITGGVHYHTAYSDETLSLDTTTLENRTDHIVWVGIAGCLSGSNGCAQSPFAGVFGQLTTANGSVFRELRNNFKTSYLWLGGTATVSLAARQVNTDNAESAVNATFTTDTPSVATVGSCALVSSCTITGIAQGTANITATDGSGHTAVTRVVVWPGTPVFPHFCWDGAISTGSYGVGACAGSPARDQIVRSIFANGCTVSLDSSLAPAMAKNYFNVFECTGYSSAGLPSTLASWKVGAQDPVDGPILTALASSGFHSFVGRCEAMSQDGNHMQWSTETGANGFAARMAYWGSVMSGKLQFCITGDEFPLPMATAYATGQIGATNGPTQFVVSGSTITVSWPGFYRAGYPLDITGATNACLNMINQDGSHPGTAGQDFTLTNVNSCANGTYKPSGGTITETGATIQIYNEIPNCNGSNGCQNVGPDNLAVANSIFQTVHTQLQTAFSPPVGMDIPWNGQTPAAQYASSVQGPADVLDCYWTRDGPENGGYSYGFPSGHTHRSWLLSLEQHFQTKCWSGLSTSIPWGTITQNTGPWYSRGGATSTVGATSEPGGGGSLINITGSNPLLAVGTKVNLTGSNCTTNTYTTTAGTGVADTVASINSSTQFRLTNTHSCTSSGGSIVIAPLTTWFTPPYDKYKTADDRGVEVPPIYWDMIAMGGAFGRTYTYGSSNTSGNNYINYPATASNAYCCGPVNPPNSPNNEENQTNSVYIFSDNPSAQERWYALGLTHSLIQALEPEIIAPACNAPDFGPRVHTGARCGPNGNLVIAISDNETPLTINFPSSLWSGYNSGGATITRLQEILGAYVTTTNLASSSTSDSFVATNGEIDLWWFPAGSTPLLQNMQVGFNPASVGAAKTSVRYSMLCNTSTFASNLDQQGAQTVFTSQSALTLPKFPGIPLCYDYQYLDSSNNPVGVRSNVQVLP